MSEETQPVTVACGECMWFAENPKTAGQGGECHKNPPAVVVISSPIRTASGSNQHINTVFPPVPVTSWCAQFVPKTAGKN